jgi:hypothetical protein
MQQGAGKTSSAAASPSMLRKAATARPLAVPQARTKSAVSVGSAKSWASHRQGMALGVGNAVPGGGARVSGENCGEIEAVETMCMETMCKVERRCTDGASTFARKRSEGDSTNVRSARVRMGIAKVMAERAGSDVTALEAEQVRLPGGHGPRRLARRGGLRLRGGGGAQVDALVEAFDAVLQVSEGPRSPIAARKDLNRVKGEVVFSGQRGGVGARDSSGVWAQVEPRNVEAYMRGGELLQLRDPARAAAAFQRFPFNFDAPDKAHVAPPRSTRAERTALGQRAKEWRGRTTHLWREKSRGC